MLIQLLPATKEKIQQHQNSQDELIEVYNCIYRLKVEISLCCGKRHEHTQIEKRIIQDIFFINKTVFVRAFDEKLNDSVTKEIVIDSSLLSQLLDNEPVDKFGFKPNIIMIIPPAYVDIPLEDIDEYATRVLTEYV